MAAFRVILCLLVFASARAGAETNAHDVEQSQVITFEIKGNEKKGFELKSEVQIGHTFLSERSTDSTSFYILEDHYVRASDIKAKLDDKKISGKYIITRHIVSRDVFLSDNDIWIINLPRKAKPGQTLTYSYKKKYLDIAYLPIIRIPNIDYLKSFVVTVRHPEEISVDFDLFFSTEELPYRVDSSEAKETRLVFAPIYAAKHLAYFPYNDTRAAILVTLTLQSRTVNPVDVPDFVRWYDERLPEIGPDLTEQKSSLLDERLDSVSGVWSKLDVINDFVRENVRYISDSRYPNGIIPHEPSTVLGRRYGDCKDRAYLVKALAGLAGIDVEMAAISTEPRPFFHGVHWALYNHVICVYSDGDSSLFFDPTAKFHELGNIPDYLIEQPALVLDSVAPRFHTVPSSDTLPTISVSIEARTDSLADARATVVVRKENLAMARHAMSDLSPTESKRYFANSFSAAYYKVALDNFELVSESKHSATFSARADLSDFIIQTQTSVYAPRSAFASVAGDILERKNDTLPLYFEQTSYATLDIHLQQLLSPPESDSTLLEGSGTGEFAAAAIPTDSNSIKLSYLFRRPSRILRGRDKENYLRFAGDYLDIKNNMFIFDGRKP